MILKYLLALWRADGIGPAAIAQLTDKQVNYERLFDDPLAATQHYQLPEKFIAAVRQADWRGVEADLTWAAQANCHIITLAMPEYPALLQQIPAAPPLLFVEGDPSVLSYPQLALVGSRHSTPVGRDLAQQFAQALVQEGLVITSGLALGIDAASHEGALIGGGKTIAVMATGADKVYPRTHLALKQRIIEQGAVVSELPIGVTVAANNFPRRNRIISGLSLGVLVIEAARESGSLITAKYALEHNREVFALPGSVHNPLARGCHALIKQGAKLVETTQEVLEELQGYTAALAPSAATTTLASLPDEQQQLLKTMGFDAIAIDPLIQRSGLTAEAVSSMLLLLELQGYIAVVPGGYLRRLHL